MSARYTSVAAAKGKQVCCAVAAAVGVFLLFGFGAPPLAAAGERALVVERARQGEQVPSAERVRTSDPLRMAQAASSTEPVRFAQAANHDVGQRVYEKWCAPCHAPGPDHPGTTALAALYKGTKPGALIDRTDLTPPVVNQFVRKGVSVMPFFRKTEISDAELDALSAFLSKGRG